MTCIAVVRGPDGVVWMGADSSSIRQGTKTTLAAGKMADLGGGVYIGVAGKHFTFQVLKHGFSPPPIGRDSCVAHWMATAFAPAVRERLEETRGWNQTEQDNEQLGSESLILVVAQGRIFELSYLCQSTETGCSYHAVGNGEDVAMGALFALEEQAPSLSPEEKLDVALRAAALHRENIAPPFTFLRCDPSHTSATHSPTGVLPCVTPASSAKSAPPATAAQEARYRADKQHDLCRRCTLSLKDRVRAARLVAHA